MISIKLFIQQIQFHPTHFCHFSRWICLTTFFIQQYVKMMSFYCNRISNWISKIRILIKNKTNRSFGAKIADESRTSDSSIDLFDKSGKAFEKYLSQRQRVEYAPSSLLLLLNHSLFFPRLDLSSSESINSERIKLKG